MFQTTNQLSLLDVPTGPNVCPCRLPLQILKNNGLPHMTRQHMLILHQLLQQKMLAVPSPLYYIK